jgi:adenosylmethionine-8-amino-7-oxononanoate aminotransferase
MNTKELTLLDKKYVWHPFTQMRDWEADDPLVIAGGKGAKLTDSDGNEYWDANSSLWVNIHGHGRQEINDAIIAQLGRLEHSTMLGLTHPTAARLAEKLIAVAPKGLTKVFYSDSGSTAVEIALKMAYQYQCLIGQPQRSRFIALEDSYHGDTIGAVSVGGISLFHGIFRRLLFPVDFLPCPARAKNVDEAAANLELLLKEKGNEIAAVILEPLVQAAAGMLLSPKGFLARVRTLCDQYGVLLIADEVATGFGRTGRMFACEHEGITPDFLCVAKGITGGYLPLAATLTKNKIYDAFLGDYAELKTFFHGHSYTANPLACAAAIASMDLFESDNVIAGLAEKIEYICKRLQKTLALPHVGGLRQCGMMIGIEVIDKPGVEYPFEQAAGALICRRARALGLITRPLGNIVIFLPPLSSTIDEIEEMLSIIQTAIEQVTSELDS